MRYGWDEASIDTHKSQLFCGEQKGAWVLTHTTMPLNIEDFACLFFSPFMAIFPYKQETCTVDVDEP